MSVIEISISFDHIKQLETIGDVLELEKEMEDGE